MLRTIGKFILYIVGAALAVSFVSGLVLTWVQKGPSAINAYIWHQILGFGLLGLLVMLVYGVAKGISETRIREDGYLEHFAQRQKEQKKRAKEAWQRQQEADRRRRSEEENRLRRYYE
ncbi:hypothetical protein [Acidithiobacillus thiooxidans]|uniref:hypothetical protein n=1 Tax=Acidithiobacillus thiooxidans TaxID=930 RepID=UPI0004E27D82|nr:hypothetical protein [Acidithiobacillus thiooxidans]